MFRPAVWQIFVDLARVKGVFGSSTCLGECVVVGCSGVQQERIIGPESSFGGQMLGAEGIGVSLEQQSS